MVEVDFRRIFEAWPGRFLVLSADLEILAASDAYLEATMTSRAALIGRSFLATFTDYNDAANETMRSSLAGVIETRAAHRFAAQTFERRPSDGTREERSWHVSNTPVLGPAGELTAILHHVEDITSDVRREEGYQARADARETRVRGTALSEQEAGAPQAGANARSRLTGVVLDITERRRLTEQVERQARIFDTTLSSITDFAYIFDHEGRFIYVNQALLNLWGLPLQAAVGKNFFDLEYPRDLASRLQQQIRHVFDTGEQLRDETAYTSPTGAGGYYEYIFTPVRGVDGRIEVVAGSTRDITARKAAEQERERLQGQNTQLLRAERAARAEAERLGHAKDEFLATLSHELRTPLNAILGWSQMLRSGQLGTEAAAQGLAVIERNAHVQRRLIEDLLDMSRIVSGKVRLDVQNVDLAEIIDAAVLALQPAAEAKQIRLTKVVETTTGAIRGDPNRLQQVIWNLLSNATKFTPAGGTVEIVEQRVGDRVDVTVRDDGAGIDPQFLPHVFERFRQSDASTTRAHGGLGLGLAIVKTLVELHGGRVSVQSEGLGQGTTFVVSLPQTVSSPLRTGRREIRPSLSHPEVLPPPQRDQSLLAGVKVLVVDDEPDGRNVIARILRECAADVAVAGSASEALEMVSKFAPDVLLSDVGMPGIDGYELMQRIRALGPEHRGGLPAAALTALARPEDRARALLAGYHAHIAKPIDAWELVAAVAALVGRATTSAEDER